MFHCELVATCYFSISQPAGRPKTTASAGRRANNHAVGWPAAATTTTTSTTTSTTHLRLLDWPNNRMAGRPPSQLTIGTSSYRSNDIHRPPASRPADRILAGWPADRVLASRPADCVLAGWPAGGEIAERVARTVQFH